MQCIETQRKYVEEALAYVVGVVVHVGVTWPNIHASVKVLNQASEFALIVT